MKRLIVTREILRRVHACRGGVRHIDRIRPGWRRIDLSNAKVVERLLRAGVPADDIVFVLNRLIFELEMSDDDRGDLLNMTADTKTPRGYLEVGGALPQSVSWALDGLHGAVSGRHDVTVDAAVQRLTTAWLRWVSTAFSQRIARLAESIASRSTGRFTPR